jgi:predicted ester cyclase
MLEQNKAIVRRLMDEDISQGLPIWEEIIHPEFFDHTNPPGMQRGIEGHKAIVSLFRSIFPDIDWHIDALIAEGDLVVARTTMTGTQQADFFGIPKTGRKVSMLGVHVMRIADDKVIEHWGSNDDLGMMRQLGAVPVYQGDASMASAAAR